MSERKIEQISEIVRGIAQPDEIAEIEKVVREAKGRIMLEPGQGFWQGKTPCWEMVRCPEMIKSECPASKGHPVACWEIAGTYCKLPSGRDASICEICRVYKRWGDNKPIAVKVVGVGIGATATPAAVRSEAEAVKVRVRR